ncbi:hypothetical protein [Ruegeria meonggei]|uniref:hypothetical protein n=1 Tax=Ruegeria meonggei TaxID=1446476 RepID=UPI00366D93D6
MSQPDFQKRIERIQSNQGTAVLIGGESLQPTLLNSSGGSRVLRSIGGLLCGLLGLVVSTILAFTASNYENLKTDADEMPGFVLSVLAAAGVSALTLLVFAVWGLNALLRFKKGRARNVLIAMFFVGMGVASLAMRTAAIM